MYIIRIIDKLHIYNFFFFLRGNIYIILKIRFSQKNNLLKTLIYFLINKNYVHNFNILSMHHMTKEKKPIHNYTYKATIFFFFSLLLLRSVRTRFGLNPKTGMDPGPQGPSNKFVECGIKS